jgi:hypothetical protein
MQLTNNIHIVYNHNAINKQHTSIVIINLSLKCGINNTCHNHIMIKLQLYIYKQLFKSKVSSHKQNEVNWF